MSEPVQAPPAIDPTLANNLTVNKKDKPEMEAYKVNTKSSLENNYIDGWMKSIKIFTDGSNAVGK
jgi:hypothetical protein